MLELLSLLATVEGAEETSKMPFYVAGGLLAVWAVLVSLAGMRGTFPRTEGAGRAVMAITLALVVAVCATTVVSS